MKKNSIQLLIILLIVILVVALTLSVTSQINPLIFWILIGVVGLFAFKVLPKMNARSN